MHSRRSLDGEAHILGKSFVNSINLYVFHSSTPECIRETLCNDVFNWSIKCLCFLFRPDAFLISSKGVMRRRMRANILPKPSLILIDSVPTFALISLLRDPGGTPLATPPCMDHPCISCRTAIKAYMLLSCVRQFLELEFRTGTKCINL